jgi:hypothetical protein
MRTQKLAVVVALLLLAWTPVLLIFWSALETMPVREAVARFASAPIQGLAILLGGPMLATLYGVMAIYRSGALVKSPVSGS